MKIIIGIPAFNEEKNIASIITKLMNITDTIIVCNDGSSDLTSEIAEKMGALVINHKKNLGYGGAIRSIFLKAKELEGDVLVTFDADGQHRIEDIENVLTPIVEKKADLVIGVSSKTVANLNVETKVISNWWSPLSRGAGSSIIPSLSLSLIHISEPTRPERIWEARVGG